MTGAELLVDAFGRVRGLVGEVVGGLDAAALAERVDPGANTVGWLVWHLTRVQDDHVSGVAGREQVWTAGGWAGRFGLPFPDGDTGFGHSPRQVAQVRADAELLTGYHEAVHAMTVEYLGGVRASEFGTVVDSSWTPPVTLGARLVSVVGDTLQHAGQAAFVRGVLERRA
jgi:hypothetical protein